MNGKTEITFGEQQTDQHTFKINDFRKFIKLEEEVRSNFIEVFSPSTKTKKIAFVVKPLPVNDAIGYKYTEYLPQQGNWYTITDRDKFFSLELLAAKGFDPPRLAGSVEIMSGVSKQTVIFGDPQNEKYEKFDAEKRSIKIKPNKISHLKSKGNTYAETAPYLVHVDLSEAEDESLEIKFSLFCPGEVNNVQERTLPDSLQSSMYLRELNRSIMADNSTTDLKISCGDKKKKKTFNVHKSFFCARSAVFRAAVEADMLEKKTSEFYIEVIVHLLSVLSTSEYLY